MARHHFCVHLKQSEKKWKEVLDQTLCDEQAGFRKERYCIDQIAILIVIVDQGDLDDAREITAVWI